MRVWVHVSKKKLSGGFFLLTYTLTHTHTRIHTYPHTHLTYRHSTLKKGMEVQEHIKKQLKLVYKNTFFQAISLQLKHFIVLTLNAYSQEF